jgi:hypothetical protein
MLNVQGHGITSHDKVRIVDAIGKGSAHFAFESDLLSVQVGDEV